MAINQLIAQGGTATQPVSAMMKGQQFAQQTQANQLAANAQQQKNAQALAQDFSRAAEWATTPEKWNQAVDFYVQRGIKGAEKYRDRFDMRDAVIKMGSQTFKGQIPSAIQEYKFYQGLPSEAEKETYLTVKRLGRETPEQIVEKEKAKVTGKAAGEKIVAQTKVEAGIKAATAKTGMLDELITEASRNANFWTTGLIGQVLQGFGSTSAHDLYNTLNGIKSNIGFDKLQQMRDQSPTGGALGQVSDRENKLLQQVWGSLEQSQSEAQFKKNLERVRKQTQESWQRVMEAYKIDYGEDYPVQNLPWNEAGKNKAGAASPPAKAPPNKPAQTAQTEKRKTINTQAEYDNLKSGEVYIDASDNKPYRKP